MDKKPKLTKAERLLEKVRKNPSPTCRDPKQIDLMDLIRGDRLRRVAFDHLDEVIRRKMEDKGKLTTTIKGRQMMADKNEAKRQFNWQAVKESVERIKPELIATSEAAHKAKDADAVAEGSPLDYEEFTYTLELGNLVSSLNLLCGADLAVIREIVIALHEAHAEGDDH